jgi:hypothetical protein
MAANMLQHVYCILMVELYKPVMEPKHVPTSSTPRHLQFAVEFMAFEMFHAHMQSISSLLLGL